MSEKSHIHWVFPWRRSFQRRWHLLLAAIIVLPIAAALIGSVQVRVFPQTTVLTKRAELILVKTDATNHDWLLKLSQKTPFPYQATSLDSEQHSSVDFATAIYADVIASPALRDIEVPADSFTFPVPYILPDLDEPNKEEQTPRVTASPQPRVLLLHRGESVEPLTYPLYVATTTPSSRLRFMIHIADDGFVDACYPLDNDSKENTDALIAWLQSLRYESGKNKPTSWQACEINWIQTPP